MFTTQEYLMYAGVIFLILSAICLSFQLNSDVLSGTSGSAEAASNTSAFEGDEIVGAELESKVMRWKLHSTDLIFSEKAKNSDFLISASPQSIAISSDLWGDDTTTNFDQGSWGSCTAFAMKYLTHFYALENQDYPKDELSVSYLYAKSRAYLNLPITNDSGASNGAAAHVMQYTGTVTETEYPYYAANVFKTPSSQLDAVEKPNKIIFSQFKFFNSANINLANLKTVLTTKPILVGLVLYPSGITNKTLISGDILMPTKADLRSGPVGGHAICLTGFTGNKFTFRNSWGSEVGKAGNFTLPFEYLTSQSGGQMSYVFDCWTHA